MHFYRLKPLVAVRCFFFPFSCNSKIIFNFCNMLQFDCYVSKMGEGHSLLRDGVAGDVGHQPIHAAVQYVILLRVVVVLQPLYT